jgi:hypothetical protein
MKTHVDIAHPRLFVQKKVQLVEKVTMVDVNHSW